MHRTLFNEHNFFVRILTSLTDVHEQLWKYACIVQKPLDDMDHRDDAQRLLQHPASIRLPNHSLGFFFRNQGWVLWVG